MNEPNTNFDTVLKALLILASLVNLIIMLIPKKKIIIIITQPENYVFVTKYQRSPLQGELNLISLTILIALVIVMSDVKLYNVAAWIFKIIRVLK